MKYLPIIVMSVVGCYILFIVAFSIFNSYEYRKYHLLDLKISDIILKGKGKSRQKGTAFLIFHGFGDSAEDLRQVGEHISGLGYDVYIRNLPGHGRSINEMRNIKAEDWSEFGLKVYDDLCKKYKKVNVLGFSLGGAIALYVAENRDVNNLFLLNAYLETYTPVWFPVRTEHIMNFNAKCVISKGLRRCSFSEFSGRRRLNGRIKHISIIVSKNMMFELIRFPGFVTGNFDKIKAPIYIFSSQKDHVVNKKSAEIIYNNAGSEKKRIIRIPDSDHHALYEEKSRAIIFTELIKILIDQK